MERINLKMIEIHSKKAHYHKDDLEIILVLEGSLTIHKIQRQLTIHEGELTFINRFIVHHIESDGAKILSVKIKLSEFKNIFEKIEYVEFLNNDELQPLERPLKERLNAIIIDLIMKLYNKNLDVQERNLNETYLMHMLYTSYQLISHVKTEEEYPASELQLRYYSIVEYIMENISQKIEIEDILQLFYMNPAYFSQFMKKINGEGFKSFLSYRKLIRIMDYLTDDNLSMTEIANAVGILNMKSFYALFNKFFEESPTKWKERVQLIEDDCYVIEDEALIERFIINYHVDKHRDNTIFKLYKYLIVAETAQMNLENIDIVLNPYLDMGEEIDEDYQVYKFLGILIDQIKKLNAHLKVIFPFHYLENEKQRELLQEAIKLQVKQYGINDVKKWKICFCIQKISELNMAIELKNQIEQSIGIMNIQITLDALSG